MIFKSIKQLDLDIIYELFSDSSEFMKYSSNTYDILKSKLIANIFFESSTRTQISFHKAICTLGGEVIPISHKTQTRCNENDAEDLRDALKVISYNCDGIVFRSRDSLLDINLDDIVWNGNFINAGDGMNEHPLQALGDCWVLFNKMGNFDFRFGFIGDCTARVFRSTFYLLHKLGVPEFHYYTTNAHEIPDDILKYDGRTTLIFHDRIENFLKSVDVIDVIPYKIPYNAPIHVGNPQDVIITKKLICKYNENMTLLHPGPRNFELSSSTDTLQNSMFFEQARTAYYMKMAVLKYVFSQ